MYLSKIFLAGLTAIFLTTSAFANNAANLIKEFYTTVDDKTKSVEALSIFFADDYVDHDRSPSAPEGVPDRAVTLNLFSELKSGFPDAIHTIEILENIGDDRAIVYWTFYGTNTGSFFGAPASGNKVEINGVDIFRVKDGKFIEQWHVEELLTLFQQIKSAS